MVAGTPRNGSTRNATGSPAATARPLRGAGAGREWAFLLPPLVLSAFVFYPITRNYFFADDFLNLYNIANNSLFRYLVTPNGGHLLVARNAVFYITRQLFGTQPEYYYWSVLLTHLVNVWLLFRVVRASTQSLGLASFGAALWGVSPLHEGTLGWYSVLGQVLVATALLVILNQAVPLAARGREPSRRTRRLWYVLALAASTSFGTGIGIALALPLVLLVLLPRSGSRWRLPLGSLILVIPALYAVLTWAYLSLSGDEMVAKALWTMLLGSWSGIALICARLVGFGLMRLCLGFWSPPGLGPDVWYGFLAVFVLGAVIVARASPGHVRRQLAACALLVLACYGIIALGRAVVILTWPEDVITKFTRYHYVGQLILTIMLCLVLRPIGAKLGARAKTLLLAAWYAATIVAYAFLAPAIDNHVAAREGTEQVLAEIRQAIQAQPPGQAVYIQNTSFQPLPFFPGLFPGRAAAFTIFHPDNTVDGRRVYFVERNPAVIEAARRGRRTATLLVSPGKR